MAERKYTKLEILQLAIAFEKSQQTIHRWIKAKDDRLTCEKALKVLFPKSKK